MPSRPIDTRRWIDSHRVPTRKGRVVAREIAGETLLVPIRDEVADMHRIISLNAVATHIWNTLDGSTAVDEIVKSVCAEFDVQRSRARKDVVAFLEELADADLIEQP